LEADPKIIKAHRYTPNLRIAPVVVNPSKRRPTILERKQNSSFKRKIRPRLSQEPSSGLENPVLATVMTPRSQKRYETPKYQRNDGSINSAAKLEYGVNASYVEDDSDKYRNKWHRSATNLEKFNLNANDGVKKAYDAEVQRAMKLATSYKFLPKEKDEFSLPPMVKKNYLEQSFDPKVRNTLHRFTDIKI
jgi:hypothetical protein